MIEEREFKLLKDVGKGDAQAFEQLYEATNKRVFQYLCRFTNDRYLAEDLTMDTYAEVWKSAGRFRGESKVATWMIGIARNMAMNEFRKNNKMRTQELDEGMSDPPAAVPCLCRHGNNTDTCGGPEPSANQPQGNTRPRFSAGNEL